MLTILQAETAEYISTARELIEEYAAWLEFKLCFQGFEEEMRSLPGKYAPPAGRLLIALWDGRPAGVIALRSLEEPGLCEMKRLYVRTEFRGHQIGRVLAERIIGDAAAVGYSRMRLDTIPGKMDRAIAMYRELGFAETDPYYQTPVRQTLFMELALTPEVKGISGQQAAL
ncbi:MAG: GNAT family N-acetyltransferase [Candidatus Angelobacter sp.]